ncbi:Zinc finger A20 and AN1 domain-containing stress-associated protein 6 [Apostasia shenzhenica]|uniref:Zinc finger A20 and AN1 domain-containing stress-associated protein 6 n=1 Tax=Apostasia shenzhenica TaxID=1088818 RepID=A0A2H9ZRA2_9ASPA|nr:Zinc finger A20 and AN1 domain-containing stress-associated protein 6 [Apostasia shenzhenica]
MAQESWKNEIDETEYQKHEGPIICANNCGFFGSVMTNNLCSKCYRDFVMNQKLLADSKPPSLASSTSKELSEEITNKQQPNRCLMCQKKVGITWFKCRCGSTFCSSHRYPETHHCSFDYKSAGREAIAKENPVVKADKIEKI